MKTIEEVVKNNFLLALSSINFTDSFFRGLAGQFPYEVATYTIYETDEKKMQKKFNKILNDSDEPFLIILRKQNTELGEILFVPIANKKNNKMIDRKDR